MENTMDMDIVESLRWIAKSAKPMDARHMELAAAEIERLRLTSSERKAIEAAIAYMQPVANYDSSAQATLLGLLERLG
jgi:hypothetical protein